MMMLGPLVLAFIAGVAVTLLAAAAMLSEP